METWLNEHLPNVMNKLPELWESTKETLYMTGVSMALSLGIGILLGVILILTKKGGLKENRWIYGCLDKIINIFRSIPFVILLASLIPLTRIVMGSAIGTNGAILPLIFGTVPFYTRQVESALTGVDKIVVEAASSMGCSTLQIVLQVYLREGIPALVRVTSITIISLIGLTTMAGAVGGGGLGDFAIRYGHQRNQIDVTYVTVFIILLMVMAIQWIGNCIIKHTEH